MVLWVLRCRAATHKSSGINFRYRGKIIAMALMTAEITAMKKDVDLCAKIILKKRLVEGWLERDTLSFIFVLGKISVLVYQFRCHGY